MLPRPLTLLRITTAAAVLAGVWFAPGPLGQASSPESPAIVETPPATITTTTTRASAARPATASGPAPSGVAARWLGSVPASDRQAVVVDAASARSTSDVVTMWQRSGPGWERVGATVPGHNGAAGWSSDRATGYLQSPIGMYTLTYAGGRQPNPGTALPYQFDPAFFGRGGAFDGGSLADVFDYVVAIDFNRLPGTPPSDGAEPAGPGPGSGIWLHVDNGVPTEGCVTVPRAALVELLRWLRPGLHPVIEMGPVTASMPDHPDRGS